MPCLPRKHQMEAVGAERHSQGLRRGKRRDQKRSLPSQKIIHGSIGIAGSAVLGQKPRTPCSAPGEASSAPGPLDGRVPRLFVNQIKGKRPEIKLLAKLSRGTGLFKSSPWRGDMEMQGCLKSKGFALYPLRVLAGSSELWLGTSPSQYRWSTPSWALCPSQANPLDQIRRGQSSAMGVPEPAPITSAAWILLSDHRRREVGLQGTSSADLGPGTSFSLWLI